MPIKIKPKTIKGGKELDIGAKKKQKMTRGERAMSSEYSYNPGVKMKKVTKRGGGDFNIEMKIPKDMINKGVMYGYKSGGQV